MVARQVHEVTCGAQAVHHIAGAACCTHAWHVAAVGGGPAVGYGLALDAGLPRVVAVVAVAALCHADLRSAVSLNDAMVTHHLQKKQTCHRQIFRFSVHLVWYKTRRCAAWQRLQDANSTSH